MSESDRIRLRHMLDAAREVHGNATLLQNRGEFPAPLEHEFKIIKINVEEKKVGNGAMTFVSGTRNKSVTLVLRGGTQQVLDSMERALDDAVHAVADVIEDQRVIPGGGASEVELSLRLREYASTLKGREQLAVAKFAEALEIVPKTLAENAGFNFIDKLVELKKGHDTDKKADYISFYAGDAATNPRIRI